MHVQPSVDVNSRIKASNEKQNQNEDNYCIPIGMKIYPLNYDPLSAILCRNLLHLFECVVENGIIAGFPH